jgi:hypothetical protein
VELELTVARRRFPRRRKITRGTGKGKRGKGSGQYTEMAKIASERFVEEFKKHHDINLKYSMDDVRLLDAELERNYESNTLTSEEIVCIGYYLGELLRRNVGGEYEFREDPGVLVLKCLDIAVFPILKVQRALEEKRPGALEAYVFLYAKKVSDKRTKKAGN